MVHETRMKNHTIKWALNFYRNVSFDNWEFLWKKSSKLSTSVRIRENNFKMLLNYFKKYFKRCWELGFDLWNSTGWTINSFLSFLPNPDLNYGSVFIILTFYRMRKSMIFITSVYALRSQSIPSITDNPVSEPRKHRPPFFILHDFCSFYLQCQKWDYFSTKT